jgi:post-segregation antitoxin (ccd killing protein)
VTPKEKSQIKREPTSIKIDPQLWKEAKIEAINRDMDLSELVENALRKDLNKLKSLSEVKEK